MPADAVASPLGRAAGHGRSKHEGGRVRLVRVRVRVRARVRVGVRARVGVRVRVGVGARVRVRVRVVASAWLPGSAKPCEKSSS